MTADSNIRFSATARLFGAAALETFARCHVAVIGIGGVGKWAVEALARSGIGRLTLVDLDEVCVTNVNRQLHALEGGIGRPKTTAMAERVRLINPACKVAEIHAFFREETADEILARGLDAVIDAIDAVHHKAFLLAQCRDRGIPAVTCGGAGGRRDPTRIRVDDLARSFGDPLCLAVRRALRSRHGFPAAGNQKNPPEFGITAVFSDEPHQFPRCEPTQTRAGEATRPLRLDCATGYGTSAAVTGTFGLTAAARVLDLLAKDEGDPDQVASAS